MSRLILNTSVWSPLQGQGKRRCQSYVWVAAHQLTVEWGQRGTGCQSYLSEAAYQQLWDGTAGGWHRRQQRARQPRRGACGTGSSAAAPQGLMLAAAPSCSCPILLLLPASQCWEHRMSRVFSKIGISCCWPCPNCFPIDAQSVAAEALTYACNHCHKGALQQKTGILQSLIPVQMLLGKLPSAAICQKHNMHVYDAIIQVCPEMSVYAWYAACNSCPTCWGRYMR